MVSTLTVLPSACLQGHLLKKSNNIKKRAMCLFLICFHSAFCLWIHSSQFRGFRQYSACDNGGGLKSVSKL